MCQLLYLIMSIFLFTLVMSKWWTPIPKRQNLKAQTNLFAAFLSASTDFVDLIEYNNIPVVTENMGIYPVLGKKWDLGKGKFI